MTYRLKAFQILFLYLIFTASLLVGMPVTKAQTIIEIATDPFIQATCAASNTTNHKTIAEPDSFSYESTIVAAFQVGRIYDGGACAIGFVTITNNGATWTSGLLPGLTKKTSSLSVTAGSFDRATDPAVAYDKAHNVWLISTLALTEAGGVKGVGIYTSRSTNGGQTWSNPVVTNNNSADPDKNWIVCDNFQYKPDGTSNPYYGNCYTQWDDHGSGNKLYMSTSTDGGLTWGSKKTNGKGVIGGQPLVRPDGTVIVPTANAYETAIGAFYSSNGGDKWSTITTIATIQHHTVAGSLREGPLPSAEIDGAGTVYVAWADCRFRTNCASNDIVFTKSTNATGTSWAPIRRVPIDATNISDRFISDRFIPGLAVDKSTSGSSARIGITYYYYDTSNPPQLNVGFISSQTTDGSSGERKWSSPTTLTSTGMQPTWVATTSQGRMVGDYISTSFDSNGNAHGVMTIATAPSTDSTTSCTITGSGRTAKISYDNCNQYLATFNQTLGPDVNPSGTTVVSNSGLNLFSSNSGFKGESLWNQLNRSGVRHRK